MIRPLAGILALVVALVVAAPAVRADEDCAQQHRRVRVPEGFADARLSFVGIGPDGQTRVGAEFPGGLRELRIVATWTDLDSGHQQRLEVFSPDGSLYQRFNGAVTATGRALTVTNRLPISGTSIVDAGLYGAWCVELFLDDEDAPIARRSFLLTAP